MQQSGGSVIDLLDRLVAAVRGARQVLILPHNDPDPDAIASAVALRELLAHIADVECRIAYRGIIGRAENQALVRYLDRPLHRLTAAALGESTPIALVDTQPGAGNNALPAHATPAIVFDHHPWQKATGAAAFADVRADWGSTATILTEYLQLAGVELSKPLATALFYGIKTDTSGLIRGASTADVTAYIYLQSRLDVKALVEIERAQVPVDYFQQLDAALHSAQVYDEVVLSFLGSMHRPDLAAELADLLLRLQGVQWAVCMGVYKQELIVSVRTRSRKGGAGRLIQQVVGDSGTAGGHGTMAAGHVPLRGSDPELLAHELGRRMLQTLNVAEESGKPLMS
jgi:nanoRNase/pAp phosphatase (c-di-AMP/oligoRNAs hydrolase)